MIEITFESLGMIALVQRLTRPQCGAVVTFWGVTRNHHQGQKVTKLSYEAYGDMAKKQLEKIRKALLKKYEISELAIHHRLGEVPIGEASLLVVVSAPHRAPAIQAMEEVVNLIKKDVPIWKKEFYEDGAQWLEPEEGRGNTKE